MRIAVMGAGALGIVIGGLLAAAGRDVVLVTAGESGAAALNANGAVITGAVEAVVPVRAVTPAGLAGRYDLVFLLTKLGAAAEALRQLLPHLHAASTVCTLQNGMPEEEVAAVVGPERTVGGVVLIGATRPAPGVSRITSAGEVLRGHAFEIGEPDGRLTPRIEAVRAVLADVGGCRVVDNLTAIRWAKLLLNASSGALTAALGRPCSAILANREAVTAAVRVADEAVRVAHACGSHLAPLQGRDPELFAIRPGDRLDAKLALYRDWLAPYGDTKGSMLQDLENGRKTEIDHINGYICRKGGEKGVPTPYNRRVVAIVTQAEGAGRVPDFAASLAVLAAPLPS